jgi:uncharacterized membrane protein
VLSAHHRRVRAQVIVWVVAMLPFFLAVAGLTIDAGEILDARREAQNIADGAARVAVMQVDVRELRRTGNVVLNYSDAQMAAKRYVRDQAQGAGWHEADVSGNATHVQVTVSRDVPTSFLRIVKINSLVTVAATADAVPCVGITSGRTLNGGNC